MIKLLLFSTILLYSGCVVKESPQCKAKEHMIKSEDLQHLIHEIDMVVYDKYKSELQRDNKRQRYALNLAQTIKELAVDLEAVSPQELHVTQNAENIKIFKSFAEELSADAQQIQNIAQNYELENLPQYLDSIQNRCNACHATFRDNRKNNSRDNNKNFNRDTK
jgi:hypothetical protein